MLSLPPSSKTVKKKNETRIKMIIIFFFEILFAEFRNANGRPRNAKSRANSVKKRVNFEKEVANHNHRIKVDNIKIYLRLILPLLLELLLGLAKELFDCKQTTNNKTN